MSKDFNSKRLVTICHRISGIFILSVACISMIFKTKMWRWTNYRLSGFKKDCRSNYCSSGSTVGKCFDVRKRGCYKALLYGMKTLKRRAISWKHMQSFGQPRKSKFMAHFCDSSYL